MSFKFNWSFFDVQDLQARCEEALTESIAQTRRPSTIVAPIQAIDVNFGTLPPKLKFQSIPAVSLNRTHIVFALKYKGDATLTLETEVQANMLCEPLEDANFPDFTRPKVLGALDGLKLPFRLTIKEIELDTMVDVVYTPDGVVVNFQEPPLKNLAIESSLDAFPFVHTMITNTLKTQLAVSFYEDIPESIWASTNPQRRPPDPFFGARRWSQHLNKFVKYTSSIFAAFVPSVSSHRPMKPFNTMALNPDAQNLAPPKAILNRACLLRYNRAKETAAEYTPMEKLDKFLEESSTVSSSASSIGGSTARYRQVRPKRRVISLQKLSNAADPKVSQRTAQNVTPHWQVSPPRSPQLQSSPGQRLPSSPSDGGGEPNSRMRTYSRRVGSRPEASLASSASSSRRGSSKDHSSPKYSPRLPRTPLFQGTEYAAFSEDDDDEGQLEQQKIPLLPPSLNWEQRRFSTPEKAEPNQRHRSFGTKQRTSSLQPDKTALSGEPFKLRSPRSPGRYSSTNDLMSK